MVQKHFILSCILILLFLTACGKEGNTYKNESTSASAETIRIGYQKFGTLIFLKAEGTLEKKLNAENIHVEWTEFPAGPQLLEALHAGSIDFGRTGEAPPVFAQAADAPLVYVGNGPSSPKGEAIIVQKDSPVQDVAELKGEKIALNKGSNVHYLLVQALDEANLTLDDLETVYLPPAEARIAFERGDVAAWAIWDPFLGAAEEDLHARVIRDGEGLVANREFFLASRSFAEKNPEVIDVLLEELKKVEKDVEENMYAAASYLSSQVGIEEPILKKVLERKEFGVFSTNKEVIDSEQEIANTFYELGLIPKKVSIKKAIINKEEE